MQMKKLFYLVFTIPFLLISCVDNVVVPVNTSFPLGQINMKDSVLLDLAGLNNIVKPNEENILSIIPSETEKINVITPDMLDTLFKFASQDVKFSQSTGINPPNDAEPSDLFDLENPIITELALEGFKDDERLDEILFATCTVRVNITNAPAGSDFSKLYWEILELDTVKRLTGQTYNIEGGSLKPINKNGKPHITVKITGQIPPMETIEGNVIIESKKYRLVMGFFGRKIVEIDPTTFDFSTQLKNFAENVEEVYFANPRLTFEFINKFDIPILAKIKEIKIDNIPLKLSADIAKTQFFIPANSPLFEGITAHFVFDNSNTVDNDLSKKININTSKITLITEAVANPTVAEDGISGGRDTNRIIDNFLGLEVNRLDANYNVELPLIGYVKGLNFEQVYNDINLSFEDAEWQELNLLFTGENSMLLDFAIDLYTYDESGEKIKLTETPMKIPAAISETEKYVITNDDKVFAVLNKEQVNAVNQCRKLILNYKSSTKNIDSKEIVRLLSPTGITLNLVIGAKLDI